MLSSGDPITAGRRFKAGLMSIFGGLSIRIGAAGIHGVLASVVAQQVGQGLRVLQTSD